MAAVSNAGGSGIQGSCACLPPQTIRDMTAAICALTDRLFGLNLLLFRAPLFSRAHEHGVTVLHMVSTVQEAHRAGEGDPPFVPRFTIDSGAI